MRIAPCCYCGATPEVYEFVDENGEHGFNIGCCVLGLEDQTCEGAIKFWNDCNGYDEDDEKMIRPAEYKLRDFFYEDALRPQTKKGSWWSKYNDYLNSHEWHEKRECVLFRDNHTCQHCGSDENLQVHHMSYKHLGESQEISSCITLCKSCHEKVHNRQF